MNHRFELPRSEQAGHRLAAKYTAINIVVTLLIVATAVGASGESGIDAAAPMPPAAWSAGVAPALASSTELPAADIIAAVDPNALEPCWAYWKIAVRC